MESPDQKNASVYAAMLLGNGRHANIIRARTQSIGVRKLTVISDRYTEGDNVSITKARVVL